MTTKTNIFRFGGFGRWIAAGALAFGLGLSTAHGAIQENFNGWTATTSYATSSKTYDGGSATISAVYVSRLNAASFVYGGTGISPALRTTSGRLTATNLKGMKSVSFYYRDWNTSAGTFTIIATQNGVSKATTQTFNSTAWKLFSWNPGFTGTSSVVMVLQSGNRRLLIDEFTLTDGAVAPVEGDVWICPETTGNLGTYEVGSTLGDMWLNCQIGQQSWNMSQVGIGLAGTENTWQSWYTLSWYADGDGSNKKVHANLNGYQFTSVGQYNIIYQANNGGTTTSWSGDGWTNAGAYPPASIGATYFTVTAVGVPTGCSVSGATTTSLTVNWTKNSYNDKVMVVRCASGATAPTPVNGTSYAAGASIGSGTVVYPAGTGTSKTDTGLSGATTYDYYVFSCNNNYYSSGVKVSGTTLTPETPPSWSASTDTATGTAGVAMTYTPSGASGSPTPTVTLQSSSAAASTYSFTGGKLTFTPAASGSYTFTFRATNSAGTADKTLTVTVKPAAPAVAVNNTTGSTIGGTISGLEPGATVMLRMYDSLSAANSDTTGTSGTDVSANVTVSGTSGTWSVSGVDGCTARSFKAWQTVNGQKSAGSAGVTGTTVTPDAPSVIPSATPTSVTLSWAAVAGATHYIVNVCPASASSSAKAVARGTTTDTLTAADFAASSTTYTSFSGVSDASDAVYAGKTAKNAAGAIQLNATASTAAGIWSTASGGKIRKVTLAWNSSTSSGRSVKVYGSSSAYASYANVTGSTLLGTISYGSATELSISGDYEYVGIVANGGALYLTSISFDWETGGASCLARDEEVAGTSWTASSGVVQGTTYDWSVVAVGGTAQCVSDAATGTVTAGAEDQAPTFAEASVSLTGTTGTAVTHTQTATGYPAAMTYSITSGSGATVSAAGEFSFTPSAAGTYAFTVQAANGVLPNATYAINVTVKPATPVVAVTTEGAGSLSGTVTGTESGATVNLRRYESQAAADADTTGTSGSAVMVSGGAFDDTGLAGCTTYYYKAWQTAGGQTSAGSAVASGTAGLAGPAVTVSAQTESSFTMQWGAVAGASSYLVQVATDNQFTPGTPATVLEEHFANSGFNGNGTTDISSSLNGKTATSGWKGSKVYAQTNAVKLGTSSLSGHIETPEMNLPSGGTVTFRMAKYDNGTTVDVDVCMDENWDSNSDWTTLDTITPLAGWNEYSVAVPAGAHVSLSFETSAKRVYLDDIVVTGGSGSGGSIIYSQAGTSPTTVTGLEPGTYYYRVQSVGGSCETWSTIGNVTLEATSPALVVKDGATTLSTGATVALGNADREGAAVTKTITLDNTAGTAALTVSGIAATGDGFSVANVPATVAAGATATFTVQFAAGTMNEGDRSGTVTISSNDGTTPEFVLNVTAHVVPGAPTAGTPAVSGLSASGATVTLGTIHMHGGAASAATFEYGTTDSYGTTVTLGHGALTASTTSGTLSQALTGLSAYTTYYYRFTVENAGGSCVKTGSFQTQGIAPVWTSSTLSARTLKYSSSLGIGLTTYLSELGTPAATFTMALVGGDAPAGTYSVTTDGTFTIRPAPADAGKTFTFTFTASNAAGSATATLQVTVTKGTIGVVGSGAFEATAGTTVTREFTINNSGATTLIVSNIVVAGTGFSLADAWSKTTIQAGGSATFTVAFAPATEGSYTGTVTLKSDDPASWDYVLNLTGTGTSASCVEGSTNEFNHLPASYATVVNDGGTWEEGGYALGMWAHNGSVNQVSAFRKFTTTGLNSGTARPLAVGDEFTIWTKADGAPYSDGYAGISFNDSLSFSAHSGVYDVRRGAIQLCGDGHYKVFDADHPDGEDTGKTAGQWRKIRFKVTSSSTFTAAITDDGGANEYVYSDRPMMNGPTASSRIQSYAVYLKNDGGHNNYWQDGKVTDTGYVTFGSDDNSIPRTISGVISDGVPANCANGSRTNRVYKKGTGIIALTGVNTFSGGVEIQGGILRVGADSALGAVPASVWPAVVILTNAALEATSTFEMSALRGVQVAGPGAGLTVDASQTLTIAGPLSGSATWNKFGDGTLRLTGVNTFTGGGYVSNGTVTAASALALGGSTSGQITVNGGATLRIEENTSAQKLVAQAGSTFAVVAGKALTVAAASDISSSTVQFDLSGDATFDGAAAAEWAIIKGATTTTNGATLSLQNLPAGANASCFSFAKSGTTLKVTYAPPAASGNDVYWRAEADDGHFVLSSGHGSVQPWWYKMANGAGYANANMTDNGPNNLFFNNGNQVAMTNDVASTVATIAFVSGNSSRTIYGTAPLTVLDAITNKAGANHFAVPLATDADGLLVTNTSSASIYFDGGFTGGDITKKGAGTLYIASEMGVGVDFDVQAGALQFNSGAAVPGNVQVASGASVKANATAMTYAGTISGAGSLLKQGTGTFVVTGENTFGGGTTVSGGTLQVGNGGTSGTLPGDVALSAGTATLAFDRSDACTFAGAVSGTGKLVQSGTGTLTLSGTSTLTGATTVSNGTLVVSGSIASSATTVASGATLSGTGTVGALAVNGTVAPGASAAAGTAGTLNVSGAVALNAGGALAVDLATTTSADKIAATGAIAANASGIFTVAVRGACTGFDKTQAYSWTIVDGNGTLTGFDASRMTVDASAFGPTVADADGAFALTAENGDIVLSWNPRPAAPTLSVGAPAADSIPVTVGNAPTGGSLVVVVKPAADAWTIAANEYPTGSLPSVGDSFIGGTVKYVGGNATAQSLAGLLSCSAYDIRVYSYLDGTWSAATASDESVETTAPAAPTSLAHGTLTATSADLSWAAVPGAASYVLDVAVGEFGTGGSGTPGESVTILTNAATSYSSVPTGWTYNHLSGSSYLIIGYSDGYVQTPEFSAATYTGLTLKFFMRTYGGPSEAGKTLTIQASLDHGSTWSDVGSASASSTTLTEKTVDLSSLDRQASVILRLVDKGAASNKGVGVKSISLTGENTPVPTTYLVANGITYSNYDVGNVTSYALTGLDETNTYTWRLRTQGAGDCQSENSVEDTFTTPQDASMGTVVVADFATAGQVAAQLATAGSTKVVVQRMQVTVTDAAVELTGAAFDLGGTAVAGDLAGYKLWVGTSEDIASATQVGAASATGVWTGLSKSLALGTHYVFLTADIQAAAVGGHTIEPAAFAASSLSFTKARKSGSATAAGATTIGKAPVVSVVDGVVRYNWAAGTGHTIDLTSGSAYPVDDLEWSMVHGTIGGSPYITPDGTNAVFHWAPTVNEVGQTVGFSFTAENSVGVSAPCIVQVTVGMGSLSAFSATPVEGNAGAMDLAWTPFGADTSVRIRYTEYAGEELTYASGGAIAYEGPASALTYRMTSGITACKTYYFKAWEVTGSTYSPEALEDTATAPAPAAPENLSVANLDYNTFQAKWNAVSGAASYLLNLYEGQAGGTLAIQDFETPAGTPTLAYENTGATIGAQSYSYPSGGTTGVGGSAGAYVVNGTAEIDFGPFDLTGIEGARFEVEVASLSSSSGNGADTGDTVTIYVEPGDGTLYPQVCIAGAGNSRWKYGSGADVAVAYAPNDSVGKTTHGSLGKLVVSNLPAVAGVTIQVEMVNNASAEIWAIDNAAIVADETRVPVSGQQNISTTNLDYTFTALTEQTSYSYTVQAVGATAECTSPASALQVTTPERCASPANVQATDGTFWDKIQVTWASRSDRGATGYKIYRATTEDPEDAVLIGTVSGGSTTSYDDVHDASTNPLALGRTYYYWVTSLAGDSESQFLNKDGGYRAGLLMRTGFEGDASVETWNLAPETAFDDDALDAPRTMLSTVTNGIEGTYALRLAPNEPATLDTVGIPSTAQNLAVAFTAAYGDLKGQTGGPKNNDNLTMSVSYDGGATWQTPQVVIAGTGTAAGRGTFAEHSFELPLDAAAAAAAGQLSVRFMYAADGTGGGCYWIDDLRLLGDASLPTVSFVGAAYDDVVEGDSAVQVTVPVKISSAAAATVGIALKGTATEGTDYTLSATTVEFAAGGATSQDVTVTIAADDLPEGTESIRLMLTGATGALVGPNSLHTIFVRDPDAFEVGTARLGGNAEADRIFATIRPDVLALENATNVTLPSGYTLSSKAGTGEHSLVVASRYPIKGQGTMSLTGGTAHWVHLDLPDALSAEDLVLFHVKMTNTVAGRASQATALASAIATVVTENGFEDEMQAIVGPLAIERGDAEAALATLVGAGFYDTSVPRDSAALEGSSLDGTSTIGYILANQALERRTAPFVYADRTFSGGQIYDTRDWNGHDLPALVQDITAWSDSKSSRPVLKLFTLGKVVQAPALEVVTHQSGGVDSATEIDWTVTPNVDGDAWVLVVNQTGVFLSPAAGSAIPAAGETFAGGTVVASGAAGGTAAVSDTLDELTACSTYYFAAFSKDADGLFSRASEASAITAEPMAPEGLVASDVEAASFTATWTEPAGNGAAFYELRVSTENPGTLDLQDKLPLASGYGIEPLTSGSASTRASGWTTGGSTAFEATGFKMGSGKAIGSITTPEMDLLANNGTATLTFDAKAYNTDSGSALEIAVITGAGTTTAYTTPTLGTDDYATYQVELAGCTAETRIRFETLASGKRAYLANVRVQQGSAAVEYVPGYDHLDTGSIAGGGEHSVAVTGLVESTKYYWQVRARGASCDSEWVTYCYTNATPEVVDYVETLGAPIISVNPIAYAFGMVAKDSAVTGTVWVANIGHDDLSVSSITFAGTGSGNFSATPTSIATIARPSGETVYSNAIQVVFAPTVGGTFNVNMVIASSDPATPTVNVALTGSCNDPETALPTILGYGVIDELGTTNRVTDHSMALESDAPTVRIYAYHVKGVESASARWRLLGLDGNVLAVADNETFTSCEPATYSGRAAQCFTATIPALGAGQAALGQYKLEATFTSSNGYTTSWYGYFDPNGQTWIMDDFNRGDAQGAQMGGGWNQCYSGAVANEAAVANERLEFFGPNTGNGGGNGYIGVYQDVSHLPYNAQLSGNDSTLTWGFDFLPGHSLADFASGHYAAAFVLGSTAGNYATATEGQRGFAVIATNGTIRLASFSGSLTANANIKALGDGFAYDRTSPVAIRVDYVPSRSENVLNDDNETYSTATTDAYLDLYIRTLADAAAMADDNPTEGFTTADRVTRVDLTAIAATNAALVPDNLELKYAGAFWSHAKVTTPDAGTCALFDNFYFPRASGQPVVMSFDVVDEDTEPPVHSDFNVRGAIPYDDMAGGLSVTGLVTDLSGVYAASNTWRLLSNGIEIANGVLAASPAEDGAAQVVGLSCTIPQSTFVKGNCDGFVFEVASTDYDRDHADDCLSSTASYPFSVTEQNLHTPTYFAVEPDGEEMVVARWNNSGEWVVIVRSDDPIDETVCPEQGVAVTNGQWLAGIGQVAYIGNNHAQQYGDGVAELIVAPGSTNYFRIFGTANSYFTASLAPSTNDPCATPAYEPNEGVDSFLYATSIPDYGDTNQAAYATAFDDSKYYVPGGTTRPATGSGWGEDNSWTGDVSKWHIHDGNLPVGPTTCYPDPVGNKLYWQDTSSYTDEGATLVRTFERPMSGDVFVAFLMNYQYGGPHKYASIALLDANGDEIVSFGKQAGWDQYASDDWQNAAAIYVPARYDGYEHYMANRAGESHSTFVLTPGEFQDYALVGQVSAADHMFRLWAYSCREDAGHAIDQIYTNALQNTVHLVASWSNANIGTASVAAIRVQAGSGAGAGGDSKCELGHVYFDEIRFGSTWDETLLFNKPEVFVYEIGEQYGTDPEGRPLYWISDGELAHDDIPFDISFNLYHRTGVNSAEFTILDPTNGAVLLWTNRLADTTTVGLVSTKIGQYSTWSQHVQGVAMKTNDIIIGTNNVYTLQVHMVAQGGKEDTVTSAAEGGKGANDLFFGEFGEGNSYDKYVELYNGTGQAIDLSQYMICCVMNPKGDDKEDYYSAMRNCTVRYSYMLDADGNSIILPHHETVVVLNGGPNGKANAAMAQALEAQGRNYVYATNDVLNVSGDDPVLLFHLPDTNNWIDACGIAEGITDQRYIMTRYAESEVPRPAPLVVDTDEWFFRQWDKTSTPPTESESYTNFMATAGIYDLNIGLGGEMQFSVYDDDIDAPVLGDEGGLEVNGERVAAVPGEREFVIVGWSFTNNSDGVESARLPWPAGLTTNACITWTPTYSNEMVVVGGGSHPGNVVFGSEPQVQRGMLEMVNIGSYFPSHTEAAWIKFETDLVGANNMVLSFMEAGGKNTWLAAQLQWSLTGGDDDAEWHSPASGWAWSPNTGGADTWAERSFDLADAGLPDNLGHLYLRILLGPDYGGNNGTYRLDNIQLTGYPTEYRLYDADILGKTFSFLGNVFDTNSGIDPNSAQLRIGTYGGGDFSLSTAGLVDGGRGTNSLLTWTTLAALDKAGVTEWYEALAEGLPIHLEVSDADDDRPFDQTPLSGDFGTLVVLDDDEEPPAIDMSSSRPVLGGVIAEWSFKDKSTYEPSKHDANVFVGALGTVTTNATVSRPKFTLYDPSVPNDYAVYHSGFHFDNKYWYADLQATADKTVTNLTFETKVSSTNAPQDFVLYLVVPEEGTNWVAMPTGTNVLYQQSVHLADTAAGWSTNAIKTWSTISVNFDDDFILPADLPVQLRLLGTNANRELGVGATWAIYDLTLSGVDTDTANAEIVVDHDLAAGGSLSAMSGYLWDAGSGLYYNESDPDDTNNPSFTLRTPDKHDFAGGALTFATPLVNGGAKEKEDGAFTATLPTMPYTNRLLGTYSGEIFAWDADDDRYDDSTQLRGDIGFILVDQDIGVPSPVGQVRVNGEPVSLSTAPDRYMVAWTNTPEFLVTFDEPAIDLEPEQSVLDEYPEAYRSKMTNVTQIGEYRVALANTPSAREAAVPVSVAVTNGALANYGFEMLQPAGWSFEGNASIVTAASGKSVIEGTNSLYLAAGGSATAPTVYAWQAIAFEPTLAEQIRIGGSAWTYKNGSSSSLRIRIEGYTDSAMTNLVTSKNIVMSKSDDPVKEWVHSAIATNALTGLDVGCLKIMVVSTGAAGYVDDIRLGVFLPDTVKPTMRYLAQGKEAQGLALKYVFAVDADNDRPDDRLGGEMAPFYTAYDITPPTAVGINAAKGASTENVDDPTTQFDVDWSSANSGTPAGEIGPDDPSSANYPTGASGNDVLSPWSTYKIYYGTYDALDCEQAVAAGVYPDSASYIVGEFINSGTTNDYKNWEFVTATNEIEDPSAASASYLALTNAATRKIRLYDLDFDQDYVVVVVGVDKAGNEGPASSYSWATNNTIKFAITQGVMRARAFVEEAWGDNHNMKEGDRESAALYWNAAANGSGEVKRDYDLIFWDASSFNESPDNTWSLVGTVRSNWFTDAGALTNSPTRLRFYRAAYKDRWRTINPTTGLEQRPLVSEDVYAMSAVQLTEEANYVSLHGYAYTNTLAGIFGTDPTIWPADEDATESTRIESYAQGARGAVASNELPRPARTYWLGSDGIWYDSNNQNANDMIDTNLFLYGCNIVLPTLSAEQRQFAVTNGSRVLGGIYWHPILRVPTNNIIEEIQGQAQPGEEFTIVIQPGGGRRGASWNFCSFMLPVQCHPSALGLESTEFTPSKSTRLDETCSILYAYDSLGKKVRSGSGMFLGSDGQWRSIYGSFAPIQGYPFRVNDVLIIVERNAAKTAAWEWIYRASDFYEFPTRWSGW